MTQYPPRAVAALADLDRLLVAHPELRGEAARLDALMDVAAVAGVDVQELAELAAVTAHAHEAVAAAELAATGTLRVETGGQ